MYGCMYICMYVGLSPAPHRPPLPLPPPPHPSEVSCVPTAERYIILRMHYSFVPVLKASRGCQVGY